MTDMTVLWSSSFLKRSLREIGTAFQMKWQPNHVASQTPQIHKWVSVTFDSAIAYDVMGVGTP